MKPALFGCFKGYKASNFVHDLMSGLLVAIIALPLSIAVGTQSVGSMAGVQIGIISSIVAGFLISALGGTKYQIGGPSPAFITVILGYVTTAGIGILGVQVATVMASIIMIALGLFRIGGMIKFIPYPIVIGFTSGIGVTLFVGQLSDFTTISSTGIDLFANCNTIFQSSFINKLYNIGNNLGAIDTHIWLTTVLPTLAIGILTFAIIFILPKINKKIPAPFIALIVATLITLLIKKVSPMVNIQTFPDVKPIIPIPDYASIPNLDFAKLILPALVIAFIASMEGLLSATVADNITGSKHNSNMELVAHGVANIANACCGGMPANGALARTSANIQNGGTTPIAGMSHSIFLLIMFFLLMPVIKYIPTTSLAAVLIMVSINMSKLKLFSRLTRFNVKDTIILLTTFLLTIIKDLVYGVLIGLAVAFVLMAVDIFQKQNIKTITSKDISYSLYDTNQLDTIIIVPYNNLTFINFSQLVKASLHNIEDYQNIILDFAYIKHCDISSLEQIKKLNYSVNRLNKQFKIINANPNISNQYHKILAI